MSNNNNFDVVLSDHEESKPTITKRRTITANEIQLLKDDTNNEINTCRSESVLQKLMKKYKEKVNNNHIKEEAKKEKEIDLDSNDDDDDEDVDDNDNVQDNEIVNSNNYSNNLAYKRQRKYKPLSEAERERRRINCKKMREIKALKRKKLLQKRFNNNNMEIEDDNDIDIDTEEIDESNDKYSYRDEGFDDEEDVMDFFSKRKEDILKKKKVNYDMPEKKKQAVIQKKYHKYEKDTPVSKYKPIALTDKPPKINTIYPFYSSF